MKKILLPVFIAGALSGSAQLRKMHSDTIKNFYTIKKSYENYFKHNKSIEDNEQKRPENEMYGVFQRWAHYMEPRVYPTGDITNVGPNRAYSEFNEYTKATAKTMGSAAITATTANWTPLGPFGSVVGFNGPVLQSGAGRINCIRFSPAGTNTVYAGAADGGLWTSTDAGTTWTTNTDLIGSLGVSDVAIDPSNTNVMYIATGDMDAVGGINGGDSKGVGVLKTTNGGLTWNTTGLSWLQSQQRFISRILINPLNTVEVFAFTTVGIYRSRDAGTTFTLVTNGNYKDAEYKPGDTTTIYAANSTSLYRSTNGGQTFVNTTFSGVGLGQIKIAVTANDPNYVYILGDNSAGNFGKLVQSTNSAATFSTMSTTPNIIGAGAQGWYDLALDANPANKNEIVVGGQDVWKSSNGGVTWTQITSGYGAGPPFIHPDIHALIYANGTTIYAGHDGGVSKSTNNGSTWTTTNGSMNISEPYGISLSASSPNVILCGLQDNGTIVYNGTTWPMNAGGDGMLGCIDWSSNNVMFGSRYNGAIIKSTNAGTSFSTFTLGLPAGGGAWVVPICQDPNVANTFYTAYTQLYKSTGGGWSQVGTIAGGGDIVEIVPCPSNSSIIYVARGSSLFKTTNSGASWTNITGTIPAGIAAITDLDVDNTNANNVYVTLSGYSAGNKVFYSNDGGSTWTNYSAGLPNLPVNCIVYKKNSPGAIYVGMDIGVYYRELSSSSFVLYNSGLPNVVVSDMEIYYPTGKLRASTFGRGVWESDLYSQPGVVPTAFASSSSNTICAGGSISFADGSSNSPTSWSWSFPGGSPASSTAQNPPSITYAGTGTYVVTVIATNSVGASTPYTTAVTVINTPTSVPTNTGTCSGQPANLIVTTNAASCVWQGGSMGMTASFAPTVTTVYGYTVYTGACASVGTATMTVGALPATPSITASGNTLTCSSATSYQWYLNGSIIPGATGQTYNTALTGDGFYSVWVGNGTGCENSSTAIFVTVTSVTELSVFQALEVSPNPAKDVLYLSFNSSYDKELSFTLTNTLGQTIRTGTIKPVQGQKTIISLDGISEGSYILNLISSGSNAKYKFIKQ